MEKILTINSWGAFGEVKKVKGGYSVVIRIPFLSKDSAKRCLDELKEASHE